VSDCSGSIGVQLHNHFQRLRSWRETCLVQAVIPAGLGDMRLVNSRSHPIFKLNPIVRLNPMPVGLRSKYGDPELMGSHHSLEGLKRLPKPSNVLGGRSEGMGLGSRGPRSETSSFGVSCIHCPRTVTRFVQFRNTITVSQDNMGAERGMCLL
jgi:hypothetical protein